MNYSIPKIIHYCWFGKQDKPDYLMNYIQTWKDNLPDYEIIEWNESNFDFNFCQYSLDAYKTKKYAFVSDVARLYALFNYGGIYLDTDVEVLKSFSDLLLDKELILSFEIENRIATSFMAASKNNKTILEFLNIYKSKKFILDNGEFNLTPNVEYLTALLKKMGLVENGKFQKLENNIYIYPMDYFSPYDYINCINNSSELTYCIHHYAVSWLNKNVLLKRKIKVFLVKTIGKNGLISLRKLKNKIKNNMNKN
ncbi:MAG: glycosyltransferase family 32 protein [Beduini sp.]|uniref:glycosyltransferase family 32 protein n=1 Tax=Beduini sp. TaxID=1922300 RepID=UPI0039A22030